MFIAGLPRKLWKDQAGFIASAELVLIATIVVLAMGVGLVGISRNVNQEVADISFLFGVVNQPARYAGQTTPDNLGGTSPTNTPLSDIAPSTGEADFGPH